MPATIIDHHDVSDTVVDSWVEAFFDSDPATNGDVVVAIPLNTPDDPTPPTTYAPQTPSALPKGTTYTFSTTPGSEFEMKQYLNAPLRRSLRVKSNGNTHLGGGYALATRSTQGIYSTPEMRGIPRIRGAWRSEVEQGSWLLLWGDNFHADGTRSGLWLLDQASSILMELPLYADFEKLLDAQDFPRFRAVRMQYPNGNTVPTGDYRIVAHNGKGAQFGWSNEWFIKVVSPVTIPGSIQTVSASADPETTTQAIESAVANLALSGGGTLRWNGGEYVLTRPIRLKPNIRHIGWNGVPVIKRNFSTGSSGLFVLADTNNVPADNNSFENMHFYCRGASNSYSYVFTEWVLAKNLRVTRCTIEEGLLGAGGGAGAMFERCQFIRASGLYSISGTLFWTCEFRGILSHSLKWVSGRESAVVSCTFDGTDRGIILKPDDGSCHGMFFYRNTFRNIGNVYNGAEHVLAEGGLSRVSVSNPQKVSDTQYKLGVNPLTLNPPKPVYNGFAHAVFRFSGSQTCECIEIVGVGLAPDYVLTLKRPLKSALTPTTMELVFGVIDNVWLRNRVYGGRGPGIMFFLGFAHGNVFEDWYSENSGSISMHRDSTSPRNTQQQNFFTNFELRKPVWNFQFGPESNEGGCVYLESSSAYNTFANGTILDPDVSDLNQIGKDLLSVRMSRPPILFNALGTNSGNLVARTHSFGSNGYLPHKGMVTRNFVTDYLHARTTDANAKTMTRDGDPPGTTDPNYTRNTIPVPVGESITFVLDVLAQSAGGEDAKAFRRRFTIRNKGGDTGLVGSVETVGTDQTTTGAAAWAVSVIADNTYETVQVQVTGAANTTIEWQGRLWRAGEVLS